MSRLASNRTFLSLLTGRLVTNAGDSVYYITSMWLVYELTGSAFYSGVAAFLVKAPSAVGFLFGPIVDRVNIRRLLTATQVVQGVVICLLAVVALRGALTVWLLLIVMPVLSVVNKFVSPAESAVLPRIVADDDQLVRANSLLTTSYQGMEILFNAVAGVMLTVVSVSSVFFLDAATFAVAALCFLGVSVPDEPTGEEGTQTAERASALRRYVSDLREGIEYLRGSVLVPMIGGAMIANFGSGAVLAALPAFADTLGGADTYGFLIAALGAGGLVGALSASLLTDSRYGVVAAVGFGVSAVTLFVAATVSAVLPTVLFVFLTAVPIGIYNIMLSSMIQSSVDDDILGRVSSLVSSATLVTMPIGNLLGGGVAELFRPTTMMYVLTVILALFALYYLLHPRLRTLPPVNEASKNTLGLV